MLACYLAQRPDLDEPGRPVHPDNVTFRPDYEVDIMNLNGQAVGGAALERVVSILELVQKRI